MQRPWKILWLVLANAVMLILVLGGAQRSALPPTDPVEHVRAFTRTVEFDYVEWMLNAFGLKNNYAALDVPRYLNAEQQKKLVYDYLDLVANTNRLTAQINQIYADPNVSDPAAQTTEMRQKRDELLAQEEVQGLLAEAILQSQVAAVLKDAGLTLLGQPIPPVLYHITPLPYALVVSPRTKIEQEANISLLPGMSLEQRIQLEDNVYTHLDKSALVVGIGGVGVYPTMVMSTTDLNWLVDTIAHEWTHNYLTLRPLGMSYDLSPELRTINETTASIAGKELGREVIRRYYPERLPPEAPAQDTSQPQATPEPPSFNFQKEMHITRVQTDALLAQGKVQEAEDYMEQRRKFFWDNGYLIRKLNQAYFAFYGAYNDQPGGTGEAGKDPVGPAVQELRQQSANLADFLNRISWVTSFGGLQRLVAKP